MTVKRFERIYADVDVFCKDHNAKGVSQLIEREDYDRIVDLLNKLHEENERLKEYNNKLMKQPLLFDVQTIPNTMEIMEVNNKLEEENEQLKQHNTELINKIDFLERVIDGDV